MSEQLIATPSIFGETGNFVLERELGKGGMGGVYLGRDKMLDRPVAVKVMQREFGADPEFVDKFKREAQAAAKLIHPNIAQIYYYGIFDGMPYIAMELAVGGSLDQIMQNAIDGKTDITRVMKIGEQVAQALRCAADRGLVHGDIKPENILLDADGNAKIVDFGLAAMQKDTSEIWGTPYYIAPEKVKKEVVDFRADMYNLGGTLYHALTGKPPFDGEEATDVVKARFERDPTPPSTVRPGLSPQIDKLILKMLAREKQDRFPSFEALLEEFKKVMATGLQEVRKSAYSQTMPKPPAGGGKTVLKIGGAKKLKVRKAGQTDAELEKAEQQQAEHPAPKAMKVRNIELTEEERMEDDGGNIAAKFLIVVLAVIAVILLTVGGLVWYKWSSKRAEEQSVVDQLNAGRSAAMSAIGESVNQLTKLDQQCTDFAEKAIRLCEEPTKKLSETLKGKYDDAIIAMLHPGPTEELQKAIALTNVTAKAEQEAKEKIEAEKKSEEAEAKEEQANAEDVAKMKARAEADEEAMHAEKPTGEEKPADEEKPAAEAPAAEEAPPAPPAPPKEVPVVVKEMVELWGRAYASQAAAIRIHVKIEEAKQLGEKAKGIGGNDETAVQQLADISNQLKEKYDTIRGSEDVTKLTKSSSFIQAKSEKTVKRELERLRIAALEKERADKKAAEEAAEKARLEKIAAEKAETIERESREIADKFEALKNAGVFTQLDWKNSLRQLEAVKDEFKWPESQIVADSVIMKVKMMKSVQDIFIQNMVGYTFFKGKLRGHNVIAADEDQITLKRPATVPGKPTIKLTWKKFYAEYHGNLNELIIRFIEKGRGKTKFGDGKLNLREWAEAMMGSALTMTVICGDDAAAATRGEAIARKAVEEFADYYKHAKAIFPEIDFGADPNAE